MLCRVCSVQPPDFGKRWFARFGRKQPAITGAGTCFLGIGQEGDYSLEFDKTAVIGKEVPNLEHPPGSEDDCEYQCVIWKNFGISQTLTNIGKITAGAAIVASLCEKFSTYNF